MLEFPRLNIIRRVKLALMISMAVLALPNLYQAALITTLNLQKLEQWPRQPATIISLAREPEIEVEVDNAFADSLPANVSSEICLSHEPDTTCLLITGNPYAWYSLFDEVELLQNPDRPELLEVLSLTGLWAPVLENLLVILLLAGAFSWLIHAGWGEDRTWLSGRWIPSELAPQRIGFTALEGEAIRESGASRNAVIFWLVMFFIIACVLLPGILMAASVNFLEAIIIMAVVTGVMMLLLYSALQTYSRLIYQDEKGVIDSNFFGVKRVPWSAVGGIELINLNEDAQARYQNRFGGGQRPQTLNVYVVSDKLGRQILRLSEHMLPTDAFEALLKRLHALAGKDQSVPEEESSRLETEWLSITRRMGEKPKSLLHRENRGLLITLVVMVLPFLLGTAYLACQNLWFIYGAERADGKIVEIKNDGLPSLLVEYKDGNGDILYIESDGVESYGAFHINDILTVYYEADKPKNARLDLFLELWFGTIFMGVITAIVIVVAILIARAMTSPMPRME